MGKVERKGMEEKEKQHDKQDCCKWSWASTWATKLRLGHKQTPVETNSQIHVNNTFQRKSTKQFSGTLSMGCTE